MQSEKDRKLIKYTRNLIERQENCSKSTRTDSFDGFVDDTPGQISRHSCANYDTHKHENGKGRRATKVELVTCSRGGEFLSHGDAANCSSTKRFLPSTVLFPHSIVPGGEWLWQRPTRLRLLAASLAVQ